MDSGQTQIQSSLIDEARRLLAAAQAQQVPMRLLGGMGIRLLLGERMDPRFPRRIEHLALIPPRRGSREVDRLLQEQGWAPEERFNALNGHRRLLFHEPARGRHGGVVRRRSGMWPHPPLAESL